eukprot:3420544-Prymnesium_polylepis.2
MIALTPHPLKASRVRCSEPPRVLHWRHTCHGVVVRDVEPCGGEEVVCDAVGLVVDLAQCLVYAHASQRLVCRTWAPSLCPRKRRLLIAARNIHFERQDVNLTYTNAVSRSTRSPGRKRPSPRRMLSPYPESGVQRTSHSIQHATRDTSCGFPSRIHFARYVYNMQREGDPVFPDAARRLAAVCERAVKRAHHPACASARPRLAY